MSAIDKEPAPNLIGEARSILADPRLEDHEALAALIAHQPEGREALMRYIFDVGIARWREKPRSRWARRFEGALSAMEAARSDLSVPFILTRSKTAGEARRRVLTLNTSHLSQPAFNAIIKCEDAPKREGAIESISNLSPEQLLRLLDRHGLTPAWFSAFDARLSTARERSPALVDAYLQATIDALTGKGTSPLDDNALLRCLERAIALTPGALERFGALFHQATFHAIERGEVTVSKECSTWFRGWLGRTLPTHPTTHTTTSHSTPVDALAHTLREMNHARRLEHFFAKDGLHLDRARLDNASWARIAAGIDNAPSHEERLRLASLLLKANDSARACEALEKLVRHWTEHGSNGSTKRAGHRRSKRAARGHVQRQAASDEPDLWYADKHWSAPHIRHINHTSPLVSIAGHSPEDARRALEEDPPHVLPKGLRLSGVKSMPEGISHLLASPILREVEDMFFFPEIAFNHLMGVRFGNMKFPARRPWYARGHSDPMRIDARRYTQQILDDAWLARTLEAFLQTDFSARLDRLWISEVSLGPRSIEVLLGWAERRGLPWSSLHIEGSFSRPHHLRRLLSSPTLCALESFSIHGLLGQPDAWDPVDSWEELTALLPVHLQPDERA